MAGQRPYTEAEVGAMAAELGRGRFGARDRGAFIFGVLTGYRASEICSVRIRDVVEPDGSVRDEVTVWRRHTKRGRTRTVLVSEELREVIEEVLRPRACAGVIHIDEWLFARASGGAISRHTLYRAQRRAANRLGLRGRVGGTHSMRKTFGKGVHDYLMDLAARGEKVDPLLGTKEAMGHGDVRSTEAYLQADSEQVAGAVRAVARRYGAKLEKEENRP
ncbi:MAG: tyrosine-type recombinase/integrase [Acholeplasmataceae bacterium]